MRLLTVFALLAAPAWAEQVTLDYSNFSNIEVREGVAAYVQVGPVETVTAIAPNGGLDGLKVQKFGQWLVFSRDPRWWFLPNWKRDRLEVVITLPELGEVKAIDRAAVTVVGGGGETLRAEASDNGDLILEGIAYDATTLVIEGEGNIKATGDCAALAFLDATDTKAGTDCVVLLDGRSGETYSVTLPEQEPEAEDADG